MHNINEVVLATPKQFQYKVRKFSSVEELLALLEWMAFKLLAF